MLTQEARVFLLRNEYRGRDTVRQKMPSRIMMSDTNNNSGKKKEEERRRKEEVAPWRRAAYLVVMFAGGPAASPGKRQCRLNTSG